MWLRGYIEGQSYHTSKCTVFTGKGFLSPYLCWGDDLKWILFLQAYAEFAWIYWKDCSMLILIELWKNIGQQLPFRFWTHLVILTIARCIQTGSQYFPIIQNNIYIAMLQSVHIGKKYPCEECDYEVTWKGSLTEHQQSVHMGKKYPCDECDYKAEGQSHRTSAVNPRG